MVLSVPMGLVQCPTLSSPPPLVCTSDTFAMLMVRVVRILFLSLVVVDGLLHRKGLVPIALDIWFVVGSPPPVRFCLCFRDFLWPAVTVLQLAFFRSEETFVHDTFSSDHGNDGTHRGCSMSGHFAIGFFVSADGSAISRLVIVITSITTLSLTFVLLFGVTIRQSMKVC